MNLCIGASIVFVVLAIWMLVSILLGPPVGRTLKKMGNRYPDADEVN
jgi:hypothetical protein